MFQLGRARFTPSVMATIVVGIGLLARLVPPVTEVALAVKHAEPLYLALTAVDFHKLISDVAVYCGLPAATFGLRFGPESAPIPIDADPPGIVKRVDDCDSDSEAAETEFEVDDVARQSAVEGRS